MEWHDCTGYAILFFEEMYVRDCLKGHNYRYKSEKFLKGD